MAESSIFNEMYVTHGGVRTHYGRFEDWLAGQSEDLMRLKRTEADQVFRRVGITFAVYGDGAGTERLIPFDVIPRIIPQPEWHFLEAGLRQRVRALNHFLRDVYHEQDFLRAGKLPIEQILRNSQYRPEMRGIDVASDIYAHIAGIDIVRAGAGDYYVLEDNLRVPSGVSYMLENRRMMMRLFPELFVRNRVAPVEHYPDLLLENLRSVAPQGVDDPTVVLLTPGMYNSRLFRTHFSRSADGHRAGRGPDLFVQDNAVYMRTTRGPLRVDVIYRRVDDDFLDPTAFRAESTLGRGRFAGRLSQWPRDAGQRDRHRHRGRQVDLPLRARHDRFYLREKPILANVPTYRCRERDDLHYMLEHLSELVVKEVHNAGGYGMLVGPRVYAPGARGVSGAPGCPTRHNYIAQPTLALSTCPTYVEAGIAPRHIDLRPYVLSGKDVTMVPGGLTRVALREGSLVVNSSQGGGTKDTWVLEE